MPALDGLARDIRQIQKESGSLTALDEPLRRTGVELPPERDEGYYAEALNFQLGMVEACAGRPEAMPSEPVPRAAEKRLRHDS